MSFYHLKVVNKANKHICIYDLSKDDVVKNYLAKYLSKKPFFVDGYNLDYENIVQFKIVETESNITETERTIRQHFRARGLAVGMTSETIIDNRSYSKEITQELINEYCCNVTKENSNDNSNAKKHIFIVHGRDRSIIEEVENFVRTIGYEPIVLFKEADSGLTIIEKIEKFTSTSCFGIVIYTECDIGYLIDCQQNARPRARQNVVFEHGYLMAKLGRNKVCALVESSNIELPSDIAGIVYKNYDCNGMWKYSIAKDMNEVGIEVDLNKIK